ncbi:MAG: HAMP domain-containing histidine kinase [Firmicutes bacterium]|nr:HAMP domain-containing histidine kinase [Bacillota bacterium]
MRKIEKLPVAKESIRSRTLVYFLVMALSMITLLWVVQEWFFSTQYSGLKQTEVIRIMDKATKEHTGTTSPAFFTELHKTAVENDMAVWFFAFKKSAAQPGFEEYTDNDSTYLRLVGESFFSEYVLSSAAEPGDTDAIYKTMVGKDPKTCDLGWSKEQETRFIKLLKLNESFDPQKLAAYQYDEQLQRLYYASEARPSLPLGGVVTRYYFYAEANLSESGVTLDIVRYGFVLLTILIVILSLIFAFLMSALISNPITKISKRAEKFAQGDYTTRFGRGSIKEINNLAATLDFAAEEISKTEELRREFIANISHDLRTPLTMIRAYAEMIRDISGKNAQKREQHSQVIIDEAERLSLLVEDIQKLSKIQSGLDIVKAVPFDLDEFCSSTLGRFEIMRERYGYKLIYESGGKNVVEADKEKISQVLYNLIGNALNYTDKQSKKVIIRQFKRSAVAVVEVEDNGKGIAEEDMDAVWDRYYRLNQQKRSVVGSGLGLSIVKNILVAHGAEYGIKSEVGKGTVFWFALPLGENRD